jgi:HEAT repeat protein
MPLFGLLPPNVEQLKARGDVEGLIKALGNKDYAVRRQAAHALGGIKDARAVEPLADALKDKEPSVRESVAEALREMGDARAVEALIAALTDSSEMVRSHAAAALGRIGDARAVEPLIAALRDREGYHGWVRQQAAGALANIKDTRAVEPLIAYAGDGYEGALVALGELGDASASKVLCDALENETLRPAAAEALRKIGGEATIQALKARLLHKNAYVCRSAADVLGRLGWTPERDGFGAAYYVARQDWRKCVEMGALAVEPLHAALTGLYQPPAAIIEALGEIGTFQAAEALVSAWESDRHGVMGIDHDAVVQALVAMGMPAVEPLRTLLTDRDLACDAAIALATLGDMSAVEPLLAASEHKYTAPGKAAAEALVKLGASAITPLCAALTNDDREIRAAAVRALDNLRWNPEQSEAAGAYWVEQRNWTKCVELGGLAVKRLISALDHYPDAATALGEIGDSRALEPLLNVLHKHKDRDMRVAAAHALGKLGDARAIEPLIAELEGQGIFEVRKASAESLVRLYRAVELSPEVKERIVGSRSFITEGHRDTVSYDKCENRRHTDEGGLGVAFPL